MFRRLLMAVCFAYLLVAFGFILLAMLNASLLDNTVFLAEADAQVIVTLSVIGILVTMVIALRMLVDSRYRRDLERHAFVPRRKSDGAREDAKLNS